MPESIRVRRSSGTHTDVVFEILIPSNNDGEKAVLADEPDLQVFVYCMDTQAAVRSATRPWHDGDPPDPDWKPVKLAFEGKFELEASSFVGHSAAVFSTDDKENPCVTITVAAKSPDVYCPVLISLRRKKSIPGDIRLAGNSACSTVFLLEL